MARMLKRLFALGLMLALSGVAPLIAATQDPPPPTKPAPVRVGGNIPIPKLLKKVEPVYPEEAKANGVQGMVIVEVVIATDGSVASAKALRPVPILDAAALDAVKQWKYEVTYVDNVAVEVIMAVTVNFTLK
jgi:protein TonB